jgi:MFS transporter, DHA1 family, tetracycline resistance protein
MENQTGLFFYCKKNEFPPILKRVDHSLLGVPMNPKNPTKRQLLTLLLIVFLDLLGVGIVIPLLAPLLLGAEATLIPLAFPEATRNIIFGLLLAAYPIAQFFGAPIIGGYSDRVGRKKAFAISLVGTSIGYVLFALGILFNSLSLLFISRLIDGFTGGNIAVAFSSMADMSTKENKTKNFGLVGMVFGIGFVIGPFIGGNLSDPSIVSWFDFATPFWFAAALSALSLVLVLTIFTETLTHKVSRKIDPFTGIRNIRKAMKFPSLRVIFIVVFLLGFGFTFFTQFFQVFLVKKFAFTQSNIGNLFAFVGVWIAITQGLLIGPISKLFKPETVLSASIFLLAGAIIIQLWPSDPIMLFYLAPLIAITHGLALPTYTGIISNLAGEESQGEVLGISQSLQAVAWAIPPLIGGALINVDIGLPLVLASIITAIAGGVFVLFFNNQQATLFHEV